MRRPSCFHLSCILLSAIAPLWSTPEVLLADTPPAPSAAPAQPAASASPATTGSGLPVGATAAQIVTCAEARTRDNTRTYPRYSYRDTSTRQGYDTDGKLQENYKVIKTITVTAQGVEEKFERGEKNGQPADVDDFFMEKLGMSKKYNAQAMNMFAPDKKGRYDFSLRGTADMAGHKTWKLAFKAKAPGESEMQQGLVWIDQGTCGVVRAEGTFPDVWVTQNIKAELDLKEFKPGLWLPAHQNVEMKVSMPLLKRTSKMIDDFSDYQIK